MIKNAFQEHKSLELYFVIAIILILLIVLTTFAVRSSNTKNNINSCNSIGLSTYKNNCILSVAENLSSPYMCNYLPQNLQSQCIDYIAENSLNVTLCSNSQSYKNQCVQYIALNTNSPRLCNKLNYTQNNYCITSLAIKNNSINICNYDNNTESTSVCNASINMYFASKRDNLSYCKSLSNTQNKTYTDQIINYSEISLLFNNASNKNNINLNIISPIDYIQSIQNGSYSPRDICYLSGAINSKNNSGCAYIQNQTISDICSSLSFSYNTTSSKNITSTNNALITNIDNFNFTAIGKSCENYTSNNLGYCSDIESIIKAVSTKNLTYCPNNNSNVEYQCYYVIAKAYNDTTYCSYILNASENSACVSAITQNIS